MLVHDDIMSEEELFILLEDRANNLYYSYSEEANKIKAVAKYPPAFGMIGTTIGMIVLLGNLGGSDALKRWDLLWLFVLSPPSTVVLLQIWQLCQ